MMTPNTLALTDLSGHNLLFNMEEFHNKEKARGVEEPIDAKVDDEMDDVDEFSDEN
jgi:hypothetical protein